MKDAAGDASGSAKSAGGDINAGAKQVIGQGEGIAKSAGKQADKIANCESPRSGHCCMGSSCHLIESKAQLGP